MATTRSFSTMLNEYAPVSLLFDEIKKRDWLLSNVEQDDSWLGGNLIVPFLGAVGSSVSFGSLPASNDIAEETAVRGQLTAYKEIWSSMIFNETDLLQHGKINEQNFLKIIPDAIERHVSYVKGVLSQNLLGGAFAAKATADGAVGGTITVAQPDRFQIGMKVQVDDDNSSPVSGYVTAVNLNTGVLTIKDARSSGSAVDLSGYTVAQNATIYQDNQQSNGFTGLKSQLLASANGGSSTLLGQTKTDYPFLQSINKSGSAVSASNILTKLFDAYVDIRRLGGGMPNKVVMSYKNFGSCVSSLETQKGAFNVIPMKNKAITYGWDSITIGGFAGALELIAVQEMEDSEIYFLDMSAIKFYTNGGMRRRKSPDNQEFYQTRATTGYTYIVDHCLFGDLVLQEPRKCGVMYSISY